ncbi:MAG: hypothetical protein JNJ48_04970 [Phycisphaerae bacterium]|nr:hypothetical protein [Phycisphaerae bacterium]
MKTRTAVLTAALTALATSTTMADTVDAKFTGTGRGSNVRITLNTGTVTVFAGQLKHSFTNGVGLGAGLSGQMVTYCADISQYVTSTYKTFTIAPVASLSDSSPMGAAKAGAIAGLYAFAGGAQLFSTASNDLATAFQLAVWEVISDYVPEDGGASLDVTAGSFKAAKSDGSALSAGVMAHLSNLLANINKPMAEGYSLLGVSNSSAQDQIVLVPSAGTASLAGVGLLCLARRRR